MTLERHVGELTIIQEFDGELGKTVWDCALVLLGMVEKSGSQLIAKNARVLDLSGGTGVLGIALSCTDVGRVVITDLPTCTPLIRRNVHKNGSDAEVYDFAWGGDASVLGGPFDVIFMSDLITEAYEEHFPGLILSLGQLLADSGVAYVGYEVRKPTRFFDLLRAKYKVAEVTPALLDPLFRSEDIHVLKVSR